MSEMEQKREQLSAGLGQFLKLLDDAESLLSASPVQSADGDFSNLIDALLPLPVDRTSIQGTNFRQLETLVRECTKCRLQEGRTNTVFGEGVAPAPLMVIGEGPGAEEDASGRAFVGKAGKYLDSWLSAIGMSRETNVYIANIVKCRPPQNRDPQIDEVQACIPYLKRQIQLVKPQILLLVGSVAARSLLQVDEGVGKLRGRFLRYEGLPVMVTYHPAGVLRNMDLKRPVWEDLKKVAQYLQLAQGGRS
ncbi:MAG: uracil-DNA glycosylase [Sphaerochaeta sp.]|jgi:DNA polymerase|uniref:uracil-DNA glycosylase n=1 Tax=Sphaerochaeta sp. TaxID=1972642 RepID=UPI002FCBFBC2